MTPTEAELLEVLGRAQSLRFLGPGDPTDHLTHAVGFRGRGHHPLGAGASIASAISGPAAAFPAWCSPLGGRAATGRSSESAARRCAALEGWSRELGLEDRVEVLHGRAEYWAHASGYRETFRVVTARSFARPAITAEIAAGLVQIGGTIVVSDPPDASPERWPEDGLRRLGLAPARPLVEARSRTSAASTRSRKSDADDPPVRGKARQAPPLVTGCPLGRVPRGTCRVG